MATQTEINSAAKAIQQGELVAFPTETVYGLGANAFDPIAVAKIFELKGRPRFDPLIVHIPDPSWLNDLAVRVPDLARVLIKEFWPGPLSLVLPKQSKVPDIVTAGLESVAIRCPGNQVAISLIEKAGVPIAAPSANRFGMVSPTTADHVRDQFGDQLPHIIDGGPCQVGVESTVIAFTDSKDGSPSLLRPGGITLEQLTPITGQLMTNLHEEQKPSSPGQLLRHYSPRTPFYLEDSDELAKLSLEEKKIGVLGFQDAGRWTEHAALEVLSEKGCVRTAAANLFAAMRRLDSQDLDLIIAQTVPEQELGLAIMDRLRRAAAK